MERSFRTVFLLLLLCIGFSNGVVAQPVTANQGWPTYGGDPGGQRYSAAKQITRANVKKLHAIWTYHTKALESGHPAVSRSNFEATPILVDDALYLSTPFDRVISLNPATGTENWTYDPHLSPTIQAPNYTSRGVASWRDSSGKRAVGDCVSRIFIATLDARLIALDASTGRPCNAFGDGGTVDLRVGIATRTSEPYVAYGNTSPATVVGDVVVVGSAVADNSQVDIESGAVRGFDVRTGKLLWTWEPIPWAAHQKLRTGAGNVWSVIAADPENNLVFLPTSAPSPDFYGGLRPGDNKDASSIVALDARTGVKVWAFQVVHHDVWDYDIAAEPLLFTLRGTPAVAVAPKTGELFVLNRLTGQPLYPVEERPVPRSGVPGEELSATQPFSSLPSLNPQTLNRDNLPGHDAADLSACHNQIDRLRYDGMFTPPTIEGTLQFPGSLGGVNWGSMSLDPETNILYANTNRSAYEIRLIHKPTLLQKLVVRRRFWIALAFGALLVSALLSRRIKRSVPATIVALLLIGASAFFRHAGAGSVTPFSYQRGHNMVNSPDAVGEISPNNGAPYSIYRRVLEDEVGRPCTSQPWGATVAIDLNRGEKVFEKPLGTLISGEQTGTVGFGAPIVMAGGLLFTAASSQPLLRAIDKGTGEEVWTGKLPVPAQSTPMTFTFKGKQYVIVCAGGHGGLGTPLGDSVVAFAL